MKKSILVFSLPIIFMLHLSSFQTIESSFDRGVFQSTLATGTQTETPLVFTQTPPGTATPFPMLTKVSPTQSFWEKLIKLPMDEDHWRVFPVPEESLGTVVFFEQIAFDSSGNGWVATQDGLVKVAGQKMKSIQYLELFGYGPIQTTVGMYDSDQITETNFEIPAKLYFPDTSTADLIIDAEDHVWLSFSGPISDLIVTGNDVIGWTPMQLNGSVQKISQDRMGVIWICILDAKGVYSVIQYQNESVKRITSIPNNLGVTEISSMAFDAENNLWLDTDAGIHVFDGKKWIPQSSSKAGDNQYQCFGESTSRRWELTSDPQGDIWGIRGVCLIHWNGSDWDILKATPADPRDLVSVVFDQDGKVWAGRGFMQAGKNYYFESDKLYAMNDLAVAPDNSVWFSTAHWLLIYDNREENP